MSGPNGSTAMTGGRHRRPTLRRWTAGVVAAAAVTVGGAATVLVGGGDAAPAHADALCDQMRAQYGPSWPCISVPTNTFTPTTNTPAPGGGGHAGSGGPAAAGNPGPGPGEGNGTPIVGVPTGNPEVTTQSNDGQAGSAPVPTPAPAVTTVAPPTPTPPTTPGTPAPPATPQATTGGGVATADADTEAFLPGSGGGEPEVPLAFWLLAGAAAFVAANPRARHAARTGWSLLDPGGSTRGQVGSARLVLIHDETSPTTYVFDMNVPDGGHTEINPDGSATVYDADGNAVSYVKRPWAFDSAGRPQKTWYTVDEDGNLVQHVEPADNALYPILADPDQVDIGANGLADAAGKPEGSTWTTPIYDGNGNQTGVIENTIPQGNGDQTVDQVFMDNAGNVTSNQRVVSNGQGGFQRWGDNADGSSAYRGQDAPGEAVYGASWDAGANPAYDGPNSTYGQSPDLTYSDTTRANGDGTYTTVTSAQQDNGDWNHTTRLADGTTVLTTSGPGGENTTVTGQLDADGNGWYTNEQGDKVDTFIDGNGTRASITTDAETGNQTFVYTAPNYGGTYANIYDADGKQIGRIQIDRDTGQPIEGWLNEDGRSTRWHNDGSVTQYGNDSDDWDLKFINPDGSGDIHYGDGRIETIDAQGNIVAVQDAPDDRNWAQKYLLGYPAGIGRTAYEGGKHVLTLTGKNRWDGEQQQEATAQAWKNTGKTVLAGVLYTSGPGRELANSGNVPGLPRPGEAGEIMGALRDGFIAREDWANGDYGYAAGKVTANIAELLIGTKGTSALTKTGRAGARAGEIAGDTATTTTRAIKDTLPSNRGLTESPPTMRGLPHDSTPHPTPHLDSTWPGPNKLEPTQGQPQFDPLPTPKWPDTPDTPYPPVNNHGVPYPQIIDPRTGTPIPHPPANTPKVPKELRSPRDYRTRLEFFEEWTKRGYPAPPTSPGMDTWKGWDVHHIIPLEFGGTNTFENLIPLPKEIHALFTDWFRFYG